MAIELATKEDINNMKSELLQEMRTLVKNLSGASQKKFLKSHEVRAMLQISPGTLQNLRINGTLPYTKVGGVIYYAQEDIIKMLNQNKVHH